MPIDRNAFISIDSICAVKESELVKIITRSLVKSIEKIKLNNWLLSEW